MYALLMMTFAYVLSFKDQPNVSNIYIYICQKKDGWYGVLTAPNYQVVVSVFFKGSLLFGEYEPILTSICSKQEVAQQPPVQDQSLGKLKEIADV